MTPDDFDTWLEGQIEEADAPDSGEAEAGAQLFATQCSGCHLARGVNDDEFAEQGNGEVIVQLRVVRLDLQCLPSVVDRALDLTFLQKSEGEIVLRAGVLWLQPDGCFELGYRLIELTFPAERDPEP